MKKEKEFNYEAAMNRIREISESIESSTISVDELAAIINEAKELTGECKNKLRSIEKQIAS